MAQKRLNMLGEVCPIPLMAVQREMQSIAVKDSLIVESDMGQTVRNIMRWCEQAGHEFQLDETENGIWKITITKV